MTELMSQMSWCDRFAPGQCSAIFKHSRARRVMSDGGAGPLALKACGHFVQAFEGLGVHTVGMILSQTSASTFTQLIRQPRRFTIS
jgi:hypothetical protein